jgi:hypothetical protein
MAGELNRDPTCFISYEQKLLGWVWVKTDMLVGRERKGRKGSVGYLFYYFGPGTV